MNIWLKYPQYVTIVAPEINTSPVDNENPYKRRDYAFKNIPAISFISFKDAMLSLVKIPEIMVMLFKTMKESDHIHLRCPGNIGVLGCICQIFFPTKPKTVKYAGNWDPQAIQPLTYKLQKWILSNTFLTQNTQILVYGEWPGQSENVKPFFTASFSETEIERVKKKEFAAPFIFLFVGNLVEGKRPLETIQLIEELKNIRRSTDQKLPARLEFYGDGPAKQKLEEYVTKNKLERIVIFKGNRPLEELKAAYQKAHFVILPSRSEGWPKAIAEGMFFGCIPIATPVSCVPWMLNYGSRGILLDEHKNQEPRTKNQDGEKEWSVVSGQWSENIKKIKELLADPERMKRMSEAAKKWSQQYTLERFEEAIKGILYKN
ncbi:glycosyltransferase family 4 protein [Salinimicrobium terrae]|uniref:glycosyltransferase family 4 protein n=1 Tax=Salinimicrobium terrae TaxID=470866 RepID=UPI0003F587B7|nr:glycosyltransferase family 4 protein [Salinimicrobium terrae]